MKSIKHYSISQKKPQEVKQILKKGGIVQQILKGAENKTTKENKIIKKPVKKFVKTVYFIARKKMVCKK